MDCLRDISLLEEIKKYKYDLTRDDRLKAKQLRIQALQTYLDIMRPQLKELEKKHYSESSLIALRQDIMQHETEKAKLETECLLLLGQGQFFSPGA